MRKKSLKPDQNGVIWVNLGWKETKGQKRSQAKFNLGENETDAQRRLTRIEELWEQIEKSSRNPLWDEFTFEIAKRLAKGELQIKVAPEPNEDADDYAQRMNRLGRRYPTINFAASDYEAYRSGQDELTEFVQDTAAAAAERFGLEAVRVARPSDGTLHQAMDKYIEWIKREYFDQAEQHVNDNGMTKIRQVKTLKEHLADRPLSNIDYQAADDMFAHFRHRPISRRTKEAMKRKSCQNYIKELARFFDWLDLSSYNWELPERFNRIKRKVDESDHDIAEEAADIFTFSDEQIGLLYKYGTPLDRLFLLLGLNCAFGVDQTGRLRISEVLLDRDHPLIRRIRRKKKVLGKHYLWKPTQVLLRWALERRPEYANEESADFLILKQSGKPFWRKTSNGNRARDIPNYWNRLLSRIREDHADFPKVGFNSLRDTSVHRIREIAGEEVASIHATHKHHSPDENLRRYSNAPWKRVFKAQRILERRLQSVLQVVPDPTIVPKQAYISLAKREQILSLHRENVPARQIAKEIHIHPSTVYRTINELAETDG